MFVPPKTSYWLALPAIVDPLDNYGSPTSFNHGLGGWTFAKAARLRLGLLVFDADYCP